MDYPHEFECPCDKCLESARERLREVRERNQMTRLEEIKSRLGCLVPKPGRDVPSCHEHSLCDCEALMLVRCLEMALERLRLDGDYEMIAAIDQELERK